jgi:nitrogenase molybdenum-cofactor synthesis protein NifE
MLVNVDKLMESGCERDKGEKLCRARGGESCAFDGAMIVLQPIADAAHIVHGPIACCGNSWEGRGSLSSKGDLHKFGFTTDMNELDIVYGSEGKLYNAILKVNDKIHPKAIFVHATCVSGLIGEDIDAICAKASQDLGVRVIPVNAPGFVGPKNLGNRIAGEVLLEHVIGTGEPPYSTDYDINLIGEYNIAGDLWHIEPVLKAAGIRVLSRITGDSTFEEITYAHRAKLNVIVCSRALINVAREMEKKYGIPYVEVSFFGKTEMDKALRAISSGLKNKSVNVSARVDALISAEGCKLETRLEEYEHLRGKKAVLYSGGVKSWSFISALMDLGIEIVAIGTKKSSFEDEEKMKQILGPDAPLVDDVSPKNLLKLLRERDADMLVAGGRNKYLAVKEGYPFIDINQERHRPYAGYDGLVNIAEDLSNGMKFYGSAEVRKNGSAKIKNSGNKETKAKDVLINPLKQSAAIGAAIVFQGINRAVPVLHSAQGCNFLGKVLMTSHFREPIAMESTKLFVEDVVMGSEENIAKAVKAITDKCDPEVIGVISSGLSAVKGDDVSSAVKKLEEENDLRVVLVDAPDYEGGLETGYAKAVESLVAAFTSNMGSLSKIRNMRVNVLAGPHLTPADFSEVRTMIESFGLQPIMLPDLSALDGCREGMSALATGGTTLDDLMAIRYSDFTLVIGAAMENAAKKLKERCNIEYRVFESITGLNNTDLFMETLAGLSGRPLAPAYARQRRILVDGMRDAQFYYGGKKACVALEPDHALAIAGLLDEMGAMVVRAVAPQSGPSLSRISADEVVIGDLNDTGDGFDILISNSHATGPAERLNVPLYQTGFPVNKMLGASAAVSVGYRGTLNVVNDMGNLLLKEVWL